jgi:Cu(I)/Ag(I) efflux system periplasmic protein CusF
MTFPRNLRTLLATALLTTMAATSALAQAADMSSGEVRKVDKSASKITIKHGELKNLDMPPMTMVFQVRDPALLEKAKKGDKVRFVAEEKDGALIVTALEAAP